MGKGFDWWPSFRAYGFALLNFLLLFRASTRLMDLVFEPKEDKALAVTFIIAFGVAYSIQIGYGKAVLLMNGRDE